MDTFLHSKGTLEIIIDKCNDQCELPLQSRINEVHEIEEITFFSFGDFA